MSNSKNKLELLPVSSEYEHLFEENFKYSVDKKFIIEIFAIATLCIFGFACLIYPERNTPDFLILIAGLFIIAVLLYGGAAVLIVIKNSNYSSYENAKRYTAIITFERVSYNSAGYTNSSKIYINEEFPDKYQDVYKNIYMFKRSAHLTHKGDKLLLLLEDNGDKCRAKAIPIPNIVSDVNERIESANELSSWAFIFILFVPLIIYLFSLIFNAAASSIF